jgi:NADPH:quinone reductase-like Zn-dependent oxidoreductase
LLQSWENLAALPEMLQTTHGSLHVGLEIYRAESILIRGGSSSIGMAALALAKIAGLRVGTTTRNPSKVNDLKEAGPVFEFEELIQAHELMDGKQ